MESLFSFPVGLFHPLQHAGLSRRTPVSRPSVRNRRIRGEGLPRDYNCAHMTLTSGAKLGPTKSSHRSVPAAWEKCIGHETRGSTARSRSDEREADEEHG